MGSIQTLDSRVLEAQSNLWLTAQTYCLEIDFCLLFLVSIARTTGMNMSVERQRIAN